MELRDILIPEELKKQVSVIIGMWSVTLNYDHYSREYFPAELFELTLEDPAQYSKRDFLITELQGIKERIEELKDLFDQYNINSRVRNLSYIRKNLEPSLYDEVLLISLQQEQIEPEDLMMLIRIRLDEASLGSIFYFCITAYLDLVKIYQFLEQELNKIGGAGYVASKASDKEAQKNSISFGSCTQAVLYHKILQEADDIKDISHFTNVKKETEDLVEMYIKHDGGKWTAKSFNKTYYKVVKGKKYSSADYEYVSRIIHERFSEENFPTVWERLKMHNKKDFF